MNISSNQTLNPNIIVNRPEQMACYVCKYLLGLSGGLANLFLIVVVCLQTSTISAGVKWLVVQYSFAYFSISLIMYPVRDTMIMGTQFNFTVPLSQYCPHFAAANTVCWALANWTEVCLAFNRLVAICFPHQYAYLKPKMAVVVCLLFAWVMAFLAALPATYAWPGRKPLSEKNLRDCTILDAGVSSQFVTTWETFIPYSMVGLMSATILVKAAQMNRKRIVRDVNSKIDRRQMTTHGRRMKLAVMLVASFVWNCVCNMPFLILTTGMGTLLKANPSLGLWVRLLRNLQVALSPLVFFAFNLEYRRTGRNLIRRCLGMPQLVEKQSSSGGASTTRSKPGRDSLSVILRSSFSLLPATQLSKGACFNHRVLSKVVAAATRLLGNPVSFDISPKTLLHDILYCVAPFEVQFDDVMSLVRQLVHFERQKNSPESHSPPSTIDFRCDSVWPNASDLILAVPQPSSASVNGIWPNLTANMCVFAVALAAFILLKKKIFNQAPNDQSTPVKPDQENSISGRRIRNVGLAIYGQRPDNSSSATQEEEKRNRIWYWRLKDAISESDYELLTRGGLGALEYVRFQRYVLLFSVMVCVMSLCVILPVNLSGHLFSDAMGGMSLANLEPQSSRLWFHILLTITLFPMAIAAMRQFGLQVPQGPIPSSDGNSRTVMFSGLPSSRANVDIIKSHFREAYPHYGIEDVSLTYDIQHLSALEDELRTVEDALKYCADLPPSAEKVHIKVGGLCGCCGSKVDAEKFYELRRSELTQQIDHEFRRWKRTNPIFFVTFANSDQAYEAYSDHQRCVRCQGRQRPESIQSEQLDTGNWTAFHAPDPSNVNWNNLSQSGWMWYLKAIVINLVLLGLIALLTTAIVALNFPSLPRLQKFHDYPAISQISPALIMLVLQMVMPKLIVKAVQWMGYWSRPKQLIAEMRYIFTDLVLAILLIPSLGLLGSTAAYFLDTHPVRRDCITLPDNGSLYINYLIFYAFISTAMSLFRVNVLVSYVVRSCKARSKAEEVVASRVDRPFAFGQEYASFLTAFTVTVVYAFFNPIIALIGVVALLMKYLLDQYMLCNVYKRSSVPTSVHAVAINQFFGAVMLQHIFMILIFALRDGLDAYVMTLALMLFIYGCILVGIVFFQVFQKVSLFQLLNAGDGEPPDGTLELGNATYLPPVLQRQQRRLVG
ncbi:Calcium permeable stress-gated cation channel 1 [Hypsibius exemplaris]|uniref:Calcium permeable stress-gated cation channel 1 n=1 Tax=Hypsibius exemplaris TaxID=2072580 RepID=A0A1W0WLS7_HYPEX|nr:Calcium permeable stress-gated cation channel 1 [Hypsibius exemplaris]